MVEVYKVVRMHDPGLHLYWSYIMSTLGYTVEYKIGVVARPQVGMLFCYKTIEDALRCTKSSSPIPILRCLAPALFYPERSYIRCIPSLDYTKNPKELRELIKEFWDNPSEDTIPRPLTWSIPRGTVLVHELTPVEELLL